MSTKSTKSLPPTFSQKLHARFGDNFFRNNSLAQYVSARVGGVAEYVVIAKTSADLCDAARLASQSAVPYCVIAGGTGVLPSDVGFPSLVIINRSEGISFTYGSGCIIVNSGTSVQTIINMAASRNLGGIEFLSAIPGTIGGAVATNATYGRFSIESCLRDVTVFVADDQEGKVVTLPAKELQLTPYRSVFLRESKFPPIILTVRLQLAVLSQQEVMRRLYSYRERHMKINTTNAQIGQFLYGISSITEIRSVMARLRISPFKLDSTDQILTVNSSRVRSVDFRNAINAIRDKAKEAGVQLDERIKYLGYWPEEEHDQT